MVQVNGYSLRVESVRENRVEAVRIRDHHSGTESGAAAAESAAPADQTFRP
jgi:hypothetical protein